MSWIQRVSTILTGLMMLATATAMVLYPDDSFELLAALLALWLTITGFRYLLYYFTMARHMVSGKAVLFLGIIVLDLGVFTATVQDESAVLIITYMVAIHMVSAVLNTAKGISEFRSLIPAWKVDLGQGILNLLMAAACVLFRHHPGRLVVLYCLSLGYTALVRIWSAFRRTAIVYIP